MLELLDDLPTNGRQLRIIRPPRLAVILHGSTTLSESVNN
jgi:hypothetical protein